MNNYRKNGKPQAGFTLIEMMIVVVIVGILAAVAYPSYNQHVHTVRRTSAQSDLVELAAFMERNYTQNLTYYKSKTEKVNPDNLPFTQSPKEGSPKFYNLTVNVTNDGNAFTLTATPIAGGGQAGDRCGVMTLIQTGDRTPTGGTCW